MIREYRDEDKEQLEKALKLGIIITGQNNVDNITRNTSRIILYEDNDVGILGFCSFERWGENKKKGEVNTYVVPEHRRKGIGTLLYNEMMKSIDDSAFDYISTVFRSDKDDPTLFYKRLGYKKWYGLNDMKYCGGQQPEPDLEFVPYEDKYFEQYAEGLRNSFYEMRKTYDFQPYFCCELNQKAREEFLKIKNHTHMLLDDEKLIASISVFDNGSIGYVFVVPSFQGKGYGKKITQFAINKALRMNTDIVLDVVEENAKAVNLYLRLGFEKVQTTHFYRLFR